MTDRPRERALTLSGPYQGQGPSGRGFSFPRPSLLNNPADDIQGTILCAQLGGFHFTPQHGGSVDELNAPTAIMENSYVHHFIEPDFPTYIDGACAL
jgi:hypothetical protein